MGWLIFIFLLIIFLYLRAQKRWKRSIATVIREYKPSEYSQGIIERAQDGEKKSNLGYATWLATSFIHSLGVHVVMRTKGRLSNVAFSRTLLKVIGIIEANPLLLNLMYSKYKQFCFESDGDLDEYLVNENDFRFILASLKERLMEIT